jgi:HPt (histidine-containing phosphotransfer) domain-containing protein
VLPDKEILDLGRLEEAFEDDTGGIAELLEMALETGAKHRRTLVDGLAAGDANVVARAAHSIKGSAGNIGAGQVARLAAELEEHARAGDLADAGARVAAIDDAYALLSERVRDYRRSLG